MKVGHAEQIIERERISRRLGGGANDSGNGFGGGHDGDDFDDVGFEDPSRDKSKFVAWFLLLVVMMTFGGMIGAYIVISTNGAAEWRPFELPPQVWLSTFLIVISSVTYQIAKNSLFNRKYDASRWMLIATTVLGAAFISSQILVWLALVRAGFYMTGNPYAGFFYILTAAHAIHVLGGVIALGSVLLRTWNDTRSAPELFYRRNLARSVGWYWHFMGVLWIVLFVMLGFWK